MFLDHWLSPIQISMALLDHVMASFKSNPGLPTNLEIFLQILIAYEECEASYRRDSKAFLARLRQSKTSHSCPLPALITQPMIFPSKEFFCNQNDRPRSLKSELSTADVSSGDVFSTANDSCSFLFLNAPVVQPVNSSSALKRVSTTAVNIQPGVFLSNNGLNDWRVKSQLPDRLLLLPSNEITSSSFRETSKHEINTSYLPIRSKPLHPFGGL